MSWIISNRISAEDPDTGQCGVRTAAPSPNGRASKPAAPTR